MRQFVTRLIQPLRGVADERLHPLEVPVEDRKHEVHAFRMLDALGALLSTVRTDDAVDPVLDDVLSHGPPHVVPTAVEATAHLVVRRTEREVAESRAARIHHVDRVAMVVDERHDVGPDLGEARHKVAHLLHVLDNLGERSPRVDPHNVHLLEVVLEEHEDGEAVLAARVEKHDALVRLEDVVDH